MSVEGLWYQHITALGGERPRCRRLSRMGRRVQFRAILYLAMGIGEGAGWRDGYSTGSGGYEEIWYWPAVREAFEGMTKEGRARTLAARGCSRVDIARGLSLGYGSVQRYLSLAPTQWWLVPAPIARRARDVHAAAVRTVIGREGGCLAGDELAVLGRWERTGQWRRCVAPFTRPQKRRLPDARRRMTQRRRRRQERIEELRARRSARVTPVEDCLADVEP